ncbi:MAG: glycosyltransferase family 4 protein [Bacteroidales bacterium]|nr:glycosyltransferase family 4 protein [Bacteroidales bacterium]
MNILHVVNIYFVLPYFIGDQFKYFKSKGYQLNVVCSESEYLKDYAQQQGFDYIETPVNRSISIGQDFKSIRAICKFIKKKKIDVVVGHTPKGGLLSMIAGVICRVPKRIYFRHGLVYETSHGVKRQILMAVDRLTSLCATKIICVSPSTLSKSIQDHLAPAKKQSILGHGTCNGVDTKSQFNPETIDSTKLNELRAKYGIHRNDYVIGYSGRLVKDKGIIELVQAFDSLKDAKNCKLLLVGMFEERDALPEDIKQRILNDKRIIYTGFINGGMEYYYSLMDLYVLPSYREGFPTGVLEAQAMEKPVVTTRVTGCCDSIVDNITGLFSDNDAIDLASKIDDIRLNNRIDGKKGRAWVVDNFDSRLIWKEIEKLY